MTTVLLFGLALALFSAAAFVVVGLGVRFARRPLGRVEATARARLLTRLGLAPFVVPAAGAVACALPSLLARIGLGEDHCHHHGGHLHLCLFHAPHAAGPVAWTLGGALLALVTVGLSGQFLAIARARRLARRFLAASSLDGDVFVVPDGSAFSAAVGLLAPVVVVSGGLRSALDGEAMEAVLAHERAHVARRDALRLAAIRAMWTFAPEVLGAPLLEELSVACEEACDAAAARAVGDPLVVADAIVAAARAARRMPAVLAPASVGFGPTATERRVRALVDPPGRALPRVPFLVLGSLALVALSGPFHHLTETLLGVVLG